jgi:hypothetical protein
MMGTSIVAGFRRDARWWVALLAVLLAVVGLALAPPATAAGTGGPVVSWGPGFDQSIVPAGLTGVTAIAANGEYSLALKSNGTVVVWGREDFSELPKAPEGLTGVTAIAAGWEHCLARTSDGTVVAWGGDNTSGETTVPAGLTGVTAVAAGRSHSLALKSDGTVVAWGRNTEGQTAVPAGLTGVTAIAAHWSHSLALKSDGTVVAWGNNEDGQATVPAGLAGVTAVAAGSSHSLALKSKGTVVAWPSSGEGPTDVPAGLTGVTAIAAGSFHSLALKSDGTVVAWPSSGEGPTDVPAGLTDVTAIAAGEEHSVAVGKLRRPDLLIARAAPGPYLGNDLYDPTAEGQTLTSTARRGRVRDFYVRVRNDGNTIGAFTLRGSAAMRGSVVRYYSAGVEITNAMRSAGGWHPLLAPGAMRQLRAQVKIGSRATIGSLKTAKVTATWQGHEPDAVKGVVRVIR